GHHPRPPRRPDRRPVPDRHRRQDRLLRPRRRRGRPAVPGAAGLWVRRGGDLRPQRSGAQAAPDARPTAGLGRGRPGRSPRPLAQRHRRGGLRGDRRTGGPRPGATDRLSAAGRRAGLGGADRRLPAADHREIGAVRGAV
ncbi:MAG: hypothetical protein AVDCRST_MAG73-3621, partial [uncultured Thermomicrobiales bacterium]